MKKLLFIAFVVAGCTTAQQETIYESPEPQYKRYLGEVGYNCDTCTNNDTAVYVDIKPCCEWFIVEENTVYVCRTANGDCTECYEWCENKGK